MFSGTWLNLWATRLQDLWHPGNLDWEAWIGICQLCPKNPVKWAEVLPPHVPLRVPEGHGLNQYPPSRHTLPFQWGNPLSMVQKGQAEWENNHQSSADNALQVRPGVWEVLSLPFSQVWGHPVPWPEELPAIHRRRPWQVIFVSLTASIRLTGSTFQRWDLDGGSEGGSDTCWTATLGIPLPLNVELDGGSDEGTAFCQTDACTSFQSSSSHPDSSNVRMSPSQTGPFTLHMVEWILSAKNLTWTNAPHPQCQIYLPCQLSHKWCGTVKHYTSMELSNITSAEK